MEPRVLVTKKKSSSIFNKINCIFCKELSFIIDSSKNGYSGIIEYEDGYMLSPRFTSMNITICNKMMQKINTISIRGTNTENYVTGIVKEKNNLFLMGDGGLANCDIQFINIKNDEIYLSNDDECYISYSIKDNRINIVGKNKAYGVNPRLFIDENLLKNHFKEDNYNEDIFLNIKHMIEIL